MANAGVCVIVGAGPGLGAACAARFATGGYAIALMCRSESSSEAAKAELTKMGATHAWMACDVTDAASVKAAFAKVRDTMGTVDVLIFNPGLKTPKVLSTDVLDIKLDEFNGAHAMFCAGALLCVQEVLPAMIAKPGDALTKKGTILFTGATAACTSAGARNPGVVRRLSAADRPAFESLREQTARAPSRPSTQRPSLGCARWRSRWRAATRHRACTRATSASIA
jgi:NAD(P)-dependent dehydrogenase (short-subunit alcohol dehydrogenase family)